MQDNSPRGVRDHQFRALRRLSIPNFSSNPQTNASHDKTRLFTQERTILRERTLFLPHSQVLKPATGWVWPGVARIKTAVNLITGKLNSTRQQKGPGHAKNQPVRMYFLSASGEASLMSPFHRTSGYEDASMEEKVVVNGKVKCREGRERRKERFVIINRSECQFSLSETMLITGNILEEKWMQTHVHWLMAVRESSGI